MDRFVKKEDMRNKDLFALKEVIKRVKEKGTNKFKLPLILNEKVIDNRIEAINKLREQSERLKEFEGKRRGLIAKHAEKDDAGNPIVYSEPNGKGVKQISGYGYPNIIEKKEEYEKALKDLQEEYKEEIERELSKEKEFSETLSQPVEPDLKLEKIPFENVPELGYEDLKILIPMIE